MYRINTQFEYSVSIPFVNIHLHLIEIFFFTDV